MDATGILAHSDSVEIGGTTGNNVHVGAWVGAGLDSDTPILEVGAGLQVGVTLTSDTETQTPEADASPATVAEES